MASTEIMEKLNGVFCDVFDDDGIKIHAAMTARDITEWDSLNHINLVVAVERAFGVKFTTKEIMTYENVGQFADSLERKIKGEGS